MPSTSSLPPLQTPRPNGPSKAPSTPPEPFPPPTASIPDLSTCSSVADLHLSLSHLTSIESTIDTRLQSLLSTQATLSHTLSRLDLLRAHLGTQVVAARALSTNTLSRASQTASRITSAVHRLDVEASRVKSTLQVVDQVSQLKECVLGVVHSMGGPQDWETAADYLHRASQLPEEIVTGEFAEDIIPSSEVPETPVVVLETARQQLEALFLKEFEKAAERGDGEAVTRFFKLFPLIGRGKKGEEVYGRYVCKGVGRRAREALEVGGGDGNGNGEGGLMGRQMFWYSEKLTRLFEHVAAIVEQHGGLVERHYGEGAMGRVVERLQREADTQGGIVVDMFVDERGLERKLMDVKSYPYSFLVQSFLPNSRTPARTASPANRSSMDFNISDSIDVKDVEPLLSEMGIMLSRWSLYSHYLSRKLSPPGATLSPVITHSLLSTKIHERLILPFTTLSTFFLRRSVEKAFQLDEFPPNLHLSPSKPLPAGLSPPFIVSAVDDVMYIIQTLLTRSLDTRQRPLITSVTSTISRVLNADFIGIIQRKLRDEYYPRGNPPSEDKLLPFLVLINSLEIASSYLTRITTDSTSRTVTPQNFPFTPDVDTITSALKSLDSTFRSKTGELVNDALTTLFNTTIKPRLRPILSEAFEGVDYSPLFPIPSSTSDSTDLDSSPDDPDLVPRRFATSWSALTIPYKRILTEKSYQKLHHTTSLYLSRLLEKRLWGMLNQGQVGELGAVSLERDVVGLVGVVVRAEGGWREREAFERCREICVVGNMEGEEWEMLEENGAKDGEEDGDGDGVEWKLEREERGRARRGVVRRG